MSDDDKPQASGDMVSPAPPRRALVIFGGDVDLYWLRLLRPGFRHCFVLLECDDKWLLYNPLSSGTELDVWPFQHEQCLRAWFVRHGYEVVDETVRPLGSKAMPWAPFSCVEAVKRALGVRAPWVMSPWQLYRLLQKNKIKGKNTLTIENE